jgi:hypothetical protein
LITREVELEDTIVKVFIDAILFLLMIYCFAPRIALRI